MPTVAETIEIMKVSQYLASADIAKGSIFGNKVDPKLPLILRTERFFLEKVYALNPNQEDIQAVADYCYALCQAYAFGAENIITNGTGGLVPGGGSPSYVLAPRLDWIVGATSTYESPFAENDISVTFDGTGGMADLRGYNIDLFRGALIQGTTDPLDGSNYYSWDINSGLLVLLGSTPQANLGEHFIISPFR